MSWVKNEQLDQLTERVQAALSSLCNIINLGLLDEEHMKTNSEGKIRLFTLRSAACTKTALSSKLAGCCGASH